MSVAAPSSFPFTKTTAPIMFSPFPTSLTFPLTVCFCAKTKIGNTIKSTSNLFIVYVQIFKKTKVVYKKQKLTKDTLTDSKCF